MKWSVVLLGLFSHLCANVDYHKLIEQFPEMFGRTGCWKHGEIEIATHPDEIKKIEKLTTQRFIRMGYSEETAQKYSTCGIIAEDHYWMWIRDAVTFPGGIAGTYDRIIWKTGLTGTPVTVIFPVIENKKILVNVNFRHATRSWEIELPRGARRANETPEEAAMRELQEETGCCTKNLTHLGNLAPETGVISGIIPVYYARVNTRTAPHQDESEAIATHLELSEKDIEEAFQKGYIIVKIKGQLTKAYCRDPFFCYAYLQAKWKRLI